MDSLALRLLPVYVDVLLLQGGLVEEVVVVLLATRHVVSLKYSRSPACVVADPRRISLSTLGTLVAGLLLAVHIEQLASQTAVL